MSVSYIVEGVKKPKLKYRLVTYWIKQLILKYGCQVGHLNYIFCNDEYLKGINTKYLKHDYYTDIVTFDYCEGSTISGDMFISIDRVVENANIFKCDILEEFLRVIVHGLLHLLKFSDSTAVEQQTMRRIETECILLFNEILNEGIK